VLKTNGYNLEHNFGHGKSLKTIDLQTQALTLSGQTAQELSELADELKNSPNIVKSSEEVAAAVETFAVEEINRAAAQIMTALEQIQKGAQQQGPATQESSAAIGEIERAGHLSLTNAKAAVEKGEAIFELMGKNKQAADELIAGVMQSVRWAGIAVSR
jgi:methyl-accepting chemotaxis protein